MPLRVGIRNGDTSTSERSRQLKSPPDILITTRSRCVCSWRVATVSVCSRRWKQ